MVTNRNRKGEIIDLTKITLSKRFSKEIFRIKKREKE